MTKSKRRSQNSLMCNLAHLANDMHAAAQVSGMARAKDLILFRAVGTVEESNLTPDHFLLIEGERSKNRNFDTVVFEGGLEDVADFIEDEPDYVRAEAA